MIPYDRLTTLFLDVGNTLVSIDFDWVASEMGVRGLACSAEELCRAEAASRPEISAWIARGNSTEPDDTFLAYLRGVVTRLPAASGAGPDDVEALCRALLPVLRIPGASDRLWRAVMPGVPEALARFRALGLELAVVSNADGTVDRSLTRLGLRPFFAHIHDSAVVGYEKPDPRIFEHALEHAGAAPEAVLHVGDLFHADVVGARSVGVHAALLDPFGDWHPVDCEVIPDLTALADRLEWARGGR